MSGNAKYYMILDTVLGKQEEGRYYIFTNWRWYPDGDSLIMDRLVGYDPSEPPDSPYRFGNGSIMAQMDEISYERAKELIGEDIFEKTMV